MTQITADHSSWSKIQKHLLPRYPRCEEAAFLFGYYTTSHNSIAIADYVLMSKSDFISQTIDYLELTDEARRRIIKRAYDIGACLIEVHSHPGDQPACFSIADFLGFEETVPHMQWRLRGQPYGAIVVSNNSFDALVWKPNSKSPTSITNLKIGYDLLFPTNLSFRRWQ